MDWHLCTMIVPGSPTVNCLLSASLLFVWLLAQSPSLSHATLSWVVCSCASAASAWNVN